MSTGLIIVLLEILNPSVFASRTNSMIIMIISISKKLILQEFYGLELEHILSPNRISYIVDGNTIVEDHIAGIPGDVFIKKLANRPSIK